jgi:parallel beta-helix repeat protein
MVCAWIWEERVFLRLVRYIRENIKVSRANISDMRRKGLSISIVMLIILGSFVLVDVTWDIMPMVEAKTWYVDDVPGGSPSEDFTSIKDAVDAASDGDTVYVYSGVYYEHIDLPDKSLTITGQNREATIIDGNGTGTIFSKGGGSETININKFTLRNADLGLYSWEYIYFINNRIQDMTGNGINLNFHNSVIDNIITNCNDAGVSMFSQNTLKGNNINNCNDGLFFSYENNYIYNNVLDGNNVGLSFITPDCTRNYISQNNTINGETVYHFYNVHGTPGSPITINNKVLDKFNISIIGKISIIDCSYINIYSNTIMNNIKGSGIFIYSSTNIRVGGNTIENNVGPAILVYAGSGVQIHGSNNIDLFDNTLSKNIEGIYGVDTNDGRNFNISITDNVIVNNFDCGLLFMQSSFTSNVDIIGNNISNNLDGIYFSGDIRYGEIRNNDIFNNSKGIYLSGGNGRNTNYFDIINNKFLDNSIGLELRNAVYNTIMDNEIYTCQNTALISSYYSRFNTLSNNIVESKGEGIKFGRESDNTYVNNTISGDSNDIYFTSGYQNRVTLLNCSFNKSKTYYSSSESILTVQWYLHTFVSDSLIQPIPFVPVCIKDKLGSLPTQNYETDSEGYVRWLVETEYTEKDTDGDTIGEKTYYTPHKITSWNETHLGISEVVINESKEVKVILDTPSYDIPLDKGWNLISLPLAQSDTSIATVLSSISGNYDKAEWYNTSEDQWHTTYDDLTDLDHTMGFWIHMKSDGTLTINGTIPNTTSIQLYEGWNMVGNPKFCNWEFDDILSSIEGNYTAIQWYDASDTNDPWKHFQVNKPHQMNDLKYMTSGRGYWIKVEQDCVWDLSNY